MTQHVVPTCPAILVPWPRLCCACQSAPKRQTKVLSRPGTVQSAQLLCLIDSITFTGVFRGDGEC